MKIKGNGLVRKNRGVGLFMFLLLIVPAFIFSAGIGIDLSRVITEYNYNENTAQLAANAGSTARDVQTGALSPGEATRRAQQICSRMQAPCSVGVSSYQIDVSVPMQPFFLVSGFFGLPTGGVVPTPNFASFTATSTANVCNSLENVGQSDLNCVRPS